MDQPPLTKLDLWVHGLVWAAICALRRLWPALSGDAAKPELPGLRQALDTERLSDELPPKLPPGQIGGLPSLRLKSPKTKNVIKYGIGRKTTGLTAIPVLANRRLQPLGHVSA